LLFWELKNIKESFSHNVLIEGQEFSYMSFIADHHSWFTAMVLF